MSENPQEKQQSVSPTGLSDQVEAQRQAENGTAKQETDFDNNDGTGNPVTNPLKTEEEHEEGAVRDASYDDDGYPLNAAKPKPDNWTEMSDEDKRAYVFASSDGSVDVQKRAELTGDAPITTEDHDAEDKNQSQEHAAAAGVDTDPEAPYGEGDGADAIEMGSNEYLAKSGKGQLFGNGPETVNVTNHAKKIAPPKGRILRDGEETSFSGTVVGQMAVVDEDVYREVYPFRSKRPSYVLVYVKGTAVPLNTLNNLGINTADAEADALRSSDDEESAEDQKAAMEAQPGYHGNENKDK